MEQPESAQVNPGPEKPADVADAKEQFRQAMGSITEEATQLVRDHPLTAVTAAAVAGFILSDSKLVNMLMSETAKVFMGDALKQYEQIMASMQAPQSAPEQKGETGK